MNDGSSQLQVKDVVNRNFKVRGFRVEYDATVDDDVFPHRFNFIGNNRTGKFRIPTLGFWLDLLPNYALGAPSEDNSFYLMLSGRGTSALRYGSRIATRFKGNVAGTQGCSCSAYGHKSPTRVATIDGPGNEVDDVVATFGTWSAKWKGRRYLE